MSQLTLERLSDDYLKHLRFERGLSPNTCFPYASWIRHAFATRMLQNGASIKAVQAALGHSDLKTTAIYVHLEEHETQKMAQFAALNAENKTPAAPDSLAPTRPSGASFHIARRQAS